MVEFNFNNMASKSSDHPRSNTLLYLAGASIVAIGLGVAIYFMSQEEDPVVTEVKQLGPIKISTVEDGTKVIDFKFFNEVMRIIKTNALKRDHEANVNYIEQRHALYKEQDWDNYE